MKIISTRERLLASSMICGAAFLALSATGAQAAAAAADSTQVEELVVTGSRIQVPGLESASPVTTIGPTELLLRQAPEVEVLLRNLPSTVPGDGGTTNNGTGGIASVDLRALGPQRTLVLMDGKRMIPNSVRGIVDISTVPVAMLERVDIVTGGASAVYGSDAIAGAVNFIMKKNFEGLELNGQYSQTGDSDGKTYSLSSVMGVNSADGRGNATLALGYSKRYPITLGARPFSILGANSASGAGLGGSPIPPLAGCSGPNLVAPGNGSGTAIPATIDLQTGEEYQFRDNGNLGGVNSLCAGFNFNPYNYFQTPNERYNALGIAHYQITDHVEAYSQVLFASTNVRQQIAPSGVFFNTFTVPLLNPYLGTQARTTIINQLNANRAADPTLTMAGAGVVDVNGNGVVDSADSVLLDIGRRTVEFGERSSTFSNDTFQLTFGLRGDLGENWKWDASVQHGQSKRDEVRAGYTNVTNVQNALNATNTTTCANGVASCVPLNLFGPVGSITPAQARYSSATAIISSNYTQDIVNFSVNGILPGLQSPLADSPVAVALGTEYRDEQGSTTPDECLKTPPTSCLGGAGGTTLPVSGGYTVRELFGEAVIPLITDQPFAKAVGLELGYRFADYNPGGTNSSWKAGLNWTIVDGFRVRVMQNRAVRVPNVQELAQPATTGLDNADQDPCSITNAANITPTLRALCIGTGMTNAQVGTVANISAQQIGVFNGTLPTALPSPETADTTTVGFVWEPSFLSALKSPSITLDYYKINIKDVIGVTPAQEILDSCYKTGNLASCALVVRAPSGSLKPAGAGLKQFTSNLKYQLAEGIELGVNFGLDMSTFGIDDKWGKLDLGLTANYYLKNEFQSSSVGKVTECVGFFGKSCGGPTYEYSWQQRTTWSVSDFQLSYLWRHQSESNVEKSQIAKTFAKFQHIPSYDYLDLAGSYNLNDKTKLTVTATNVFDKNPPIIGATTATTSANNGNTLPRNYDALGRIYTVGINLRF